MFQAYFFTILDWPGEVALFSILKEINSSVLLISAHFYPIWNCVRRLCWHIPRPYNDSDSFTTFCNDSTHWIYSMKCYDMIGFIYCWGTYSQGNPGICTVIFVHNAGHKSAYATLFSQPCICNVIFVTPHICNVIIIVVLIVK